MNDCPQCDADRSTQLLSGAVACSYCPRFRLECEAQNMLKLCLEDRRERLCLIESKRGKRATDKLREVMKILWAKKRPAG